MYELPNVSAKTRNLADESRGDEVELLGGRQKNVVDLIGEMSTHRGELKFELEIRNRA